MAIAMLAKQLCELLKVELIEAQRRENTRAQLTTSGAVHPCRVRYLIIFLAQWELICVYEVFMDYTYTIELPDDQEIIIAFFPGH